MLRGAVWLPRAMRKVVKAGLVRGRSTEEKGPASKVRLELLWGEKEGIPGERMRQQRYESEDEQGVGLSEERDVSETDTPERLQSYVLLKTSSSSFGK